MRNIKENMKIYNFIFFVFLFFISYASESQDQSINGDCNVQIYGDKSNARVNCMPEKYKEKGHNKVDSVSLVANYLDIGVINPPPDNPIFIMNGVDISRMLKSEGLYEDRKTYTFEGSPKQLNLVVGDNRIIIKYGELEIANAFRVTESQLEDSKRMASMSEQIHQSMEFMSKTMIYNMKYSAGYAAFFVMNPPDGEPVFFINGKDITRDVKINNPNPKAMYYSFEGSPNRFNLVSGKNKIAIQYGDTVLEDYFKLTDIDLKKAYNIFGFY